MSATEVIALALRGHQKWVDDDMPADETECCAEAVLDALKAAGYAVVELPASTGKGDLPDEGWWQSFPEGVSATGPNGRVFDQDADIAPREASLLGAALLAAADAAERTEPESDPVDTEINLRAIRLERERRKMPQDREWS